MQINRQSVRFESEVGRGWFGFVLRGSVLNLSNTYEPTYNYEQLTVPIEADRNVSCSANVYCIVSAKQ
jgi:hypothetical protein